MEQKDPKYVDYDFVDMLLQKPELIKENQEMLITLIRRMQESDEILGTALCLMFMKWRIMNERRLDSTMLEYYAQKIMRRYYKGAMNYFINIDMEETNVRVEDLVDYKLSPNNCRQFNASAGRVLPKCSECDANQFCKPEN